MEASKEFIEQAIKTIDEEAKRRQSAYIDAIQEKIPEEEPVRGSNEFYEFKTEKQCVDTQKYGKYITKDSGRRQEFPSGMKRDTAGDKPRYDLIYKPVLKRWAELMGRGAVKYGENNWTKANSIEEAARFLASLERHLQQYLNVIKYKLNNIYNTEYFVDVDKRQAQLDEVEDHAAAVLFNISASEFLLSKLGSDDRQEEVK